MAKLQQGIGSITVWMIVFVALWLTSTVFLVVLYTGQEELNSENEQLQAANSRLISPAEERSIQLASLAQAGGPTVVGLLEEARAGAAFVATGSEEDTPEVVRAKRGEVVGAIRDDGIVSDPAAYEDASLLEALTMLYEAFKAERAVRDAAEERIETLDAEVARLVQLSADQGADFEERAGEFSAQLAEAEASYAAHRAERDSTIERIENEINVRGQQCDADLTAVRQRNSTLERRLSELQQRYAAREQRLGELLTGPEELATARQPDGAVLTAIPGDDVVYIDLGREDGLTLGMQFSVYPGETGIPADGRAKAQIEVVAVAESSAECEIIRAADGGMVLEGDLIANPVYDPKRQLTFLTIGEFDLDRDGTSDPDAVATIEAMIARWGGVITDELDALTDFVILGAPPRQPKPAAEVSPEQRERNEAVRRVWERYTELLTSARSLSVPVMTQEVFLSFLGNSGRSAQR